MTGLGSIRVFGGWAQGIVAGLACLACILAAGSFVAGGSGIQIVLAASTVLLAAGLGLLAPTTLVYAIVAWLAVLGATRRITGELSPAGEVDPLLVVAPFGLVLLVFVAWEYGAFRNLTTLSRTLIAFSALTFVGAINPLQGSFTAGFTGLLFVLVPTLAFWIGRSLCDDRALRGIFKLVAALGVLVALYGLQQTFRDFPSWDHAWIQASGYEALDIGGVTRAFASFSSSAEYAFFVAIALVAWLALGTTPRLLILTIPAVCLLGFALVYASARGIVFTFVLALALMVAARVRLPFALSAILAAALIVLVTFAAAALPASTRSLERAATPPAKLLAHQLDGLADPLDPDSSTLGLHIELFKQGLRTSLAEPFGLGLGTVSLAGEKFGGESLGTETDPSNVAVALGLPGLALYLVLLVVGMRQAYRLAVRRQDRLGLLALGVITVPLFQWLNGALYAVSVLIWLTLGWVDRVSRNVPDPGV
jgi:hypothetical protein